MKACTNYLLLGIFCLCKFSFAQVINTTDVIICPSCAVSCSPNEVIYEQTEDVVYINPFNNQIAIVGNNSREKPSAQSNGVFITNDGGQTWSENYNVGLSNGDPTVSIDNNGQFYFGGLTNKVGIFKFDQADILNPLVWNYQLIDNDNSSDKPHFWIDNYSGLNNLYYGYTRPYSTSSPNQQVVIKKTNTNNFNTWSPEVIVSDNVSATYAHHGINICTGPQGQVYTVWSIYDSPFNVNFGTRDEDGIGFAKLDAVNFQTQITTRFPLSIRGTRGSGVIHANGSLDGNQITMFPTIAANQQNGHIYIVWTNIGVPGTNTGDPDIYFIKSEDEGVTWSSPIRVNQDPINNNKNQFFPIIACDPNTGVIAVGYLDSRDNHPLRNYYVSLSADEGQSWFDHQVSDAAFDNSSGATNDYTGVDIKNNYVIPVWNQKITDAICNVSYDNAFTSPFSVECPSDINNLCNINESGEKLFKASNQIAVAGDPTTCYYNILSSGGTVTLQAGNNVKLANGFHAENGSSLHCYINANCNMVGSFAGGNNLRIAFANNSFPSHKQDNYEIQNFKVYPNPAQNKMYLTFNLSDDEQTVITLNDISGRVITILDKNLSPGFYKTEIDLEENNLTPGIYFLQLTTGHRAGSIKFAKTK